jgi:hypothetical protein
MKKEKMVLRNEKMKKQQSLCKEKQTKKPKRKKGKEVETKGNSFYSMIFLDLVCLIFEKRIETNNKEQGNEKDFLKKQTQFFCKQNKKQKS